MPVHWEYLDISLYRLKLYADFTCFKEVFLEPHDEIEGEVEVAKVGQGGDHPSVDGDQVVGAEVHRGQGGVV